MSNESTEQQPLARCILDAAHKPQPCPDVVTWGRWMENDGNRVVRQTDVGDVQVSTVFLGINHAFSGGPPVLFETMVFGGPLDQEQERWCTWDEALAGHEAWLAKVSSAAPRLFPKEIDDYDWKEAFGCAGANREDVAEVLHVVEGESDGDSWVGIFKRKDGRFLYVTAWCDYTGWGCRDGGSHEIRDTLDEIIRGCCGEDDRKRLGLSLPEDPK